MRHRSRRAGERLRAAETHREVGDLQCIEERERLLLAALEVEREGRARASAVAPEDVGLARPVLEKAEIADLLDLRMGPEEIAYLGGVLTGAAHPEFERLEASEQHPGRVR